MLLVVPLLLALLLESPLEPELGLLLALSLEACAPPFEPLSEFPGLAPALPFPLPLLALFSLLGEAESDSPELAEPPSEFPEPFDPFDPCDPFDGPKEPGAE